MKKCLLQILVLLFASAPAFAQVVSGKVTSNADGQPLAGVSILVKGTSSGTTTDTDGNFSVNATSDQTLVVSFIGFATREIAVGNSTTLSITLQEDVSQLNEVVVTALGIEREKKELGYAVQDVNGDQLTQSRDVNVANALAGKVAGVQIRQNGTGVGGSTRITIRGNNTIAGANQPLIVVDGIPISNFAASPDDYWGNSNIDKGSGLGDISPDDIATISVLKGPGASALYGSRGANGVILVTTKSGKNAKSGLTVGTNLTFESPMMTPDFQNTYGQGRNNAFDENVASSWGPAMDGSTQVQTLGSNPFSARDNDIYKDFLRTGSTWTNSVEFVKAAEDMTLLAGVTHLTNKSVVPNSGLDRTSVNLRTTAKVTDWLSVDAKLNYINQNADNRISIARDPNNIFMDNLYRPRSIAFSDYEPFRATNWKRPDGKPAAYLRDHNAAPNNVFWSTERNRNSDNRDRYVGFLALDFTITDWLTLKLRSGMDNYTLISDMTRATGNPYWEQGGSYRVQTERFKETNSDFLLTAKKDIGKIGVNFSVGGNIMTQKSTLNNDFSGELEIPEFYSISAGKEHRAEFTRTEKQINSLYAAASLSYASQLFLDLTVRQDWASSLANPYNDDKDINYAYPSVGASWIFTETVGNLGPISFGKLRASFARVGAETDAYRLINTFALNYNIRDGVMGVTRDRFRANPDLKNESVQSVEGGLELLFGDRIGLDVSVYKTNTFDQILQVSIPAATGYQFDLINAGNVQNSGVEIALNTTPVMAGDFKWESSVNFAANRNKVIELREGLTRQDLSLGALPIAIVAEVGGSYGDIYGTAYERDDNGNIVVGADGRPLAATDRKKLGNAMPKALLGWSNTLTYKNLALSFLIDGSFGGDVFMGSIQMGSSAGTLAITEPYREGGLIVEGVQDSDGSPNTTPITAEQYWTGIAGIHEAFVYDATTIRFRELTLSYSVPQSIIDKTPFKTIRAGIVGRNLFMISSKTEGFDPEAGYSTAGSAIGAEHGSMPTMRSIGFNVKLGL